MRPPPGVSALHWHPLDPPGAHREAAAFGVLVAKGVVTRAMALAVLLAEGQRLRPPHACPGGLQVRLTWQLDDAARAHEARQDWVERDMRAAVLDALKRRLPEEAVYQAAHDADPGKAFCRRDREAIADRVLAWALRTSALKLGVVKLGVVKLGHG